MVKVVVVGNPTCAHCKPAYDMLKSKVYTKYIDISKYTGSDKDKIQSVPHIVLMNKVEVVESWSGFSNSIARKVETAFKKLTIKELNL